jgi:hypothetical protein
VAAGDQFILDTDHDSDGEGVAQPWATVASVGAGEVTLNLDPAYTGTHTTGTYKIRKVYAVPANERWQYTMVNDVFCFTNGFDDVQKYTGTGYASALDSTNAKKARHCTSYDDRLILGDFYISTTRYPYTMKWSELQDPTHWDVGTYPTAGEKDFIETEDFLTGFGRVGSNLVVFKEDSFYIGSRTGTATSPFEFPTHRMGIGNIAPYGIIEFRGTCAWVGRDDFWAMNGDQEESIGESIRHKFFDIVGETEIKKVWGASNSLEHEIMWTANTSEGKFTFVFNYVHNEFYVYKWGHSIISMGRGAI